MSWMLDHQGGLGCQSSIQQMGRARIGSSEDCGTFWQTDGLRGPNGGLRHRR
ncbi:hypothetical protein B0H12DRAFT_1092997 [Mycena haematopus]|nr:hypothetical protein B0H12DRAFT_1122620 [Mycena haematopus]KAJ7271304.1 hypothetical protein B0H12DRAFT_1092997 [Mycena haematopus]